MKQPTTLNECFEVLNDLLSDKDIDSFKSVDERTATARAHHGLGRWMRNNWGLWKGSELKQHFEDMGLWNADDMSGVILDSYHRHLNGKDLDVEGQVAYYKDYWKDKKDESSN